MKKYIPSALLALGCQALAAQESTSAYNVLSLPTSSHVAALGGKNITLTDDDPATTWSNPALLAGASDRQLGLNFLAYTASTSWMGANFVKAVGERHTVAALAQYMNYGSMDETDANGNVLGKFKAKDIVVGGGYSYLLSDRWSGGANLKWLFSNLADYSAVAMTVDLGLNYYDEETDLSLSATVQNLGVQLKGYTEDHRSHPPVTLNAGFSKGMAHAPVRFHFTLADITRWKSKYFALPDAETEEVKFSKKFLNHLVVGVDVLATDYLYFAAGYNFRRAYELKAIESAKMAGLSIGAGLQLKRLKLELSYAKYHLSTAGIQANVNYAF